MAILGSALAGKLIRGYTSLECDHFSLPPGTTSFVEQDIGYSKHVSLVSPIPGCNAPDDRIRRSAC